MSVITAYGHLSVHMHFTSLQQLEAELAEREAGLNEGRQLCKELCDVTKEASTKFDLKSKLTSVERPFADFKKKIGEFANSLATSFNAN